MDEPDTNDETEIWQEFRDDDADPVRVEGFPLSYVEESISLYSTRSIEYSHDRLCVRLMDDGRGLF
jgi:hypothetical protein